MPERRCDVSKPRCADSSKRALQGTNQATNHADQADAVFLRKIEDEWLPWLKARDRPLTQTRVS
jgi:hypothetical protein